VRETLDELKSQKKMFEQALAYTQMSIDPSLAYHFEFHTSAQAIYDEAMAWLDADNKQHLHGLVVAFRQMFMKDSETCTEWFDRLRRAAGKLIVGGHPVGEQEAIDLAIVGARHPRFYALQQHVVCARGSMSYADVVALYEDADRMNLRMQPSHPNFPTYVKLRQNTNPATAPVVPGYFAPPAGRGGAGRATPSRGRGGRAAGAGSGRGGSSRCAYCGRDGHSENRCYKKMDDLHPPVINSDTPVTRAEHAALAAQLAGFYYM
jgi:hypothetical protein